MQKITPFLWFDNQAEEAVKLYTSIFKRSKVLTVVRYGKDAAGQTGRPTGSVMMIAFELEGQRFVALNGGPFFKFNESISFVINCRTQSEVDFLWKKLSAGGQESQCGWLKDRFGVSWQIVPSILEELLGCGNSSQTQHVMEALLKMRKLDIKTLENAAKSIPRKPAKRLNRQFATEPF
jgi:predicted 3-demethylubiquinone-9 3-methyltransferase (glyoxalase superfamily)